MLFGAKDEDSDPLKSEEDAPGTNISLQIGGGTRSDQEDDSEEDEWGPRKKRRRKKNWK